MPFYEYQCSACGHQHEELQKVSDGPLRKCPACGRSTLKRLVSAPGFRLQGGGWYETDFKKDGESQRNIAGEKESPAEKAKDEKPKDEKAKDEKAKEEKPKDEKAESKPAESKLAEKKADSAPKPAARKKQKTARPKAARRRPARR
jgi:putative FmdB family regulatory protein